MEFTEEERKIILGTMTDMFNENRDIFDACKNGDIDFINNYKGDLNITDGLITPILVETVYANQLDVVKLLISRGVDINELGNSPDCALHIAIEKNYDDIARYLISKSADVNCICEDEWTPLYLSLYKKNYDLFDYMVRFNDIDINAENGRYSLLYFAMKRDDFDVIKYLLDIDCKKINVIGEPFSKEAKELMISY